MIIGDPDLCLCIIQILLHNLTLMYVIRFLLHTGDPNLCLSMYWSVALLSPSYPLLSSSEKVVVFSSLSLPPPHHKHEYHYLLILMMIRSETLYYQSQHAHCLDYGSTKSLFADDDSMSGKRFVAGANQGSFVELRTRIVPNVQNLLTIYPFSFQLHI